MPFGDFKYLMHILSYDKFLIAGFLVICLFFNSVSVTFGSHSADPNIVPSENEYCQGNEVWQNEADGTHTLSRRCPPETTCKQTSSTNASGDEVRTASCEGEVHLGAEPAGLNDIEAIYTRVVQVSVGLAFVALVVVLTFAGFKYLTSAGDGKAIGQASATITWAGIGMLFLIISWIILQLIEAFTGIKVTIFDVKQLCWPGNAGC